MIRPLRPLPQQPYEKAKKWLHNHKTLHFFLHHTYCRILNKYTKIEYTEFSSKHTSAKVVIK